MPLNCIWYTLFTVAAYLFGALPFMIFIGHIRGLDLSREPDLHSALWYRVGRNWGLLGFFLDVFKGVLPVLVSFFLGWPVVVALAGSLAALAGQVASLSFTYATPWILIVALIPAGVGFFIRTARRWKTSGNSLNERMKFGGSQSRSLPLGVIIGFASTPVTSVLFSQPAGQTLGLAGMVVLLLLRRLTGGLRADLKNSNRPGRVMLNRLLYDRSEV
jgi:hypothetical protein